MKDYPLPAHAASIWTVGDQIMVAFPAATGDSGHTVPFPATPKGIAALLTVLAAREHESHRVISTKASPSRYQIERALVDDPKYKAWLGAMATTQAEKDKAKAELEELGL